MPYQFVWGKSFGAYGIEDDMQNYWSIMMSWGLLREICRIGDYDFMHEWTGICISYYSIVAFQVVFSGVLVVVRMGCRTSEMQGKIFDPFWWSFSWSFGLSECPTSVAFFFLQQTGCASKEEEDTLSIERTEFYFNFALSDFFLSFLFCYRMDETSVKSKRTKFNWK